MEEEWAHAKHTVRIRAPAVHRLVGAQRTAVLCATAKVNDLAETIFAAKIKVLHWMIIGRLIGMAHTIGMQVTKSAIGSIALQKPTRLAMQQKIMAGGEG